MTDNYDQLALSWVRKEINNTLDQARQGLENFAEDTQDQTQIQFCINCLHQVQGTLQMLEFSGAARLAQEMEYLADKMSNDTGVAVESSFEVLMRALLQMPGYLQRVEEGQKDIPVVLLPLINELRSASGLTALEERELFSAGSMDVLPPKAVEKVSEQDKTSAFQENAKKLRAHYQKGLTGLIRGQSVKECLSRIHKVLLRLEALTEGHSVARLWWVADGFIFSIAEGGQYKKKEVHQLLAQVDKQIKRLSDQGSSALEDKIPESLLSQLLYYVARSKSRNERVQALKSEFDLESNLVDSEQVQESQQRLARPDSTAVTNVVDAINEEIASLKDQLDLFVRAQAKDPSSLQNLVDSLNRISDTLTLLELAIPRDVVRQQIRSIQKLIDLNSLPDDAVVMDIAGALLFVEANLKNVNLEMKEEAADEAESSERSEDMAKESQVDEATFALIKVARKSMQSAKDSMINYIASGFDRSALEDVPKLLDEVLGGVRIVQFDKAAEILQTAKEFIEQRIIAIDIQPKEELLDALADVVTSVEYYLEASEEGSHRGVGSILKGAQKSIDTLTAALREMPVVEKAAEVIAPAENIPSLEEVEQTLAQQEASEAHQEQAPAEVVTQETAEVIPIMTPAAEKEVDETLIDDEVLEIFLEEAEEEIETIEEMLPRWINNPQDEDALTTIRRSFHTLKGSGRLVGASTIGEFSWAIENMLNKVIEESVPAETPVTSTLNEAFSLLPAMVDAFSKQQPIEVDYQQVIAKAEHISAGKPISEFVYQTAAETTQAPEVEESAQEESIDPVLLEIFTAEADGHLESITEFLAAAPAEGSIGVTDELIRALHTLKGSAHMAGVDSIAALTGPWEKHARLVKGSNQRFEQPAISLLRDTQSYLGETLAKLKAGETPDVAQSSALQQRVLDLKAVAGDSGADVKQRDQQFVSIFLTEGLDILHEVSKLNESLGEQLDNQTLKDSISKELQAFWQGAKMLAIDELESLAKLGVDLANFVAGHGNLSGEVNDLFNEVVDGLNSMLNRLASEENLQSPQALVDKVSQWIESAGMASAPEDMDVELVELFVEEGEELIEMARDLLARWKDNLNSKEINGELRRIYHTLKGSSRMAGAMSIGELGYAAEDMFNTVVDFGREVSEKDYGIVSKTTDKLDSMIAELKTLRWPLEPTREIQEIRHFLSPDTVPAPEPESAPSVVEVAEPELELESLETDTLAAEESMALPEVESDEFELADEATDTEEFVEMGLDESALVEDEYEIPVLEDSLELEQQPQSDTEGEIPFLDEESIVEGIPESAEEIQIQLPEELTEEEIPTIDETVTEETVADLPEITFDEPSVETSEEIPEFVAETESLEVSEIEAAQPEEEEAFEFGTPDEELLSESETAEEIEALETTDATDQESLLESHEDSEEASIETADEEAMTAEFAEESVAEEPLEQELVAEEPYIEESFAEESVVEDSMPEEPRVETEEMSAPMISEVAEDSDYQAELVAQAEADSTTEVVVEDTIAPAAPVVVTGDVHQVELDEDGEEVLEIYLEEADELLVALDESLHDWSESHDNKDAIDLLQRTLHTFKGGARLSDLVILGDLTHEMETYFEKVNSGEFKPNQQSVDFMLQGYDVIENLVNEVRNQRQMTKPTQFMQQLESLIKNGTLGDVSEQEAVADKPVEEIVETLLEQETAETETKKSADVVSFEAKKQQQEEAKQKAPATQDVVRVTSNQLENLVNLAGETSIFRARLEQQMSVLRYNLEEMTSTVERLREQLRNLDIETDAQISYRREISGGVDYEDFDPLEMDRYTRQQELTRGLSESAVDLLSLKETLDMLTADSETLLLQQGRVATEMQESLMRTRMIPFESLVPRLRRMVRQISTELGKTIELSISADGEMDRTVLERMIAPLEHMLRNAMDHGVEPPEERVAAQKPETGSVKISMYREGNEVFIKIQDDGRGLNLQAIRHKAIEKGLINDQSVLSDHELQQLILEAGFSTAEKVTQISGRGVGMDVVASEIKQLGGIIEIDSIQGSGTTFTVKLPFTMSVNHALMVQISDDVYAIPLSNIEGIVRVSPFELEEYYNNPGSAFEYAGIDYSMYYLGQILDHQSSANLQGVTQPLPVLLLHGADHPTALQVDDLLGSREIVVKSIGSQLSSISGLSGATILGDGRVVLILDMPALIRRIDVTTTAEAGDVSVVEVEDIGVPKVMVVDDSITVRKVTTRLLERHDFEVITAKDGVDALTVLGEQKPDVMLLDIEMPRMDGFELATIIRHDQALKDLPIIMITSRTGEKHRERAEQIGVNQYMGKPYNEVDLLESISALLPKRS
ncbi:response regulator [Aliikangiella marina]|uniref:Chemotaxis protein CheA n=1 Tax=Aliikangiella marina TaxID=1712262 RepID=A0A545T9W6_9GAMM|nr:Hpt domain-containing protein [Aliikangiella marina]TQV74006.1 response regulator [Aliikangiella marina]